MITEVSATRFRFAHALVRGSLYESLTTARQVALHRRTAEAIEAIHEAALDDYVPALAHHWAKASAPITDIARAVKYAQRAGDRALALLAHDEANSYYASGLELLDAAGTEPTDRRRVELLIGRGEAQRRGGDAGYRQTLLDAARLAGTLGDARALARAALANTLGFLWTTAFTVDADKVEVLEDAIAAIGDDDASVRARLMATLGLELAWQPDPTRRLALSAEALQIARSLADPVTLAEVLLARDYTITAPDNVTERLEATTELLAIADEVGNPVLASRALSLRFKAALEMADVAEAERSLTRNMALVEDLGQPGLTWAVRHHEATLLILREDERAETAVAAAEELGVSIGNGPIFAEAQRYSLRPEQGLADEIEPWYRLLAERSGSPFVKAVHSQLLVDVGQTSAAAAAFDEIAATGFYHPTNTVAWLGFMIECAWLAAHFGRKDAAPFLRAKLEPYSHQFVTGAFAGWIGGAVAHYLALLCRVSEDWEAAEAYFVDAAVTHERMGSSTWLGRTRLEWARMLLARGRPDDAEQAAELLRQALATARDRGLTKLEREATQLLAER
ncbi:MAG TPA: hypothetical protein VJS45_03370 [Acidimicrobiia bacterium]|nr:hypothetical protein [Acidimicrobiia bacterium]